MFLFSIFQWWYTNGWAERWRGIFTRTSELAESFSLGIILKTLFKPWKQTTSLSSGGFFQKLVDNTISRFVGFWIRLFVLFGGLFYIFTSFLVNVVVAIIWPLVPVSPILFITIGLGLL